MRTYRILGNFERYTLPYYGINYGTNIMKRGDHDGWRLGHDLYKWRLPIFGFYYGTYYGMTKQGLRLRGLSPCF